MLSLDAARAHLLALSESLPAERVTIDAIEGRVLATDVVARVSLPGFDGSAMDGYAVRSASYMGEGPWTFPVDGEAKAGGAPSAVAEGAVRRIFTGAPVPPGLDAVVMQEDVRVVEGGVEFTRAPKPGAHVRKRGEDVAEGTVAIARGSRLGAGHVGLLASLGVASVEVARRPVVAIACLGDELKVAGEALVPGALYESNGPMLSALVRRAGGEPRLLPILRDDATNLASTFTTALDGCDVLLTVGGASVGSYDFARPALEAAGVGLDFWKVDIKPGKPVAVGKRGRTVVLALPGNPAAAFVTFTVFGAPLLRRMQGDASPVAAFVKLPLANPYHRKSDRPELVRSRLERVEGRETVRVHAQQSSGALSSLAWCDVLVLMPKERTHFEAGELVDVLRLADA